MTAGFRPVAVLDVELTRPMAGLETAGTVGAWSGALVLGRAHGVPVGRTQIPASNGELSAEWLERELRLRLGPALARHLAEDRLHGAGGAERNGELGCVLLRRQLLADAPAISVIIPTRDRGDQVAAAVRSILAGSYPHSRFEVLVVDNVPRDERTRTAVTELAAEGPVRYLVEPLSGASSARNRGTQAAEGDYVAFTDDDATVDPNWLTELALGFTRHPVGVVAGSALPRRLDTSARVLFERYGGFTGSFPGRVYGLGADWPADEPLFPFRPRLLGSGNNVAFRADVLRQVGGWDPGLGYGTPSLSGADIELLLRTVLLGHRVLYRPEALIWHDHRASYAELRRQLYASGAGLVTYLLKTLASNPRAIPRFLAVLPRGLAFALSSSSGKNVGKAAGYPADLTRAELAGMLYGPVGYWRSRRCYGPHRVPRARPGRWR
jgi:glycosyltransferase involved in cell wall biosynthesis